MLQDAYPEESERDDLEIAVFLQLLQDARDTDVEPLQEWLSHLDDECLLHYLPKNHHMFNGLREETTSILPKTHNSLGIQVCYDTNTCIHITNKDTTSTLHSVVLNQCPLV